MRKLLTPRWLLTHALTVGLIVVFIIFGWWQLHRAEAGNVQSWAYAVEWPSFALLVIVFWLKIVRDEVHPRSERQVEDPLPDDEDAVELATYNRYLAQRARPQQPQ